MWLAGTAKPVDKVGPLEKDNTPQNKVEPTSTITATPLPERLAILEPTPGWEVPGIDERKLLLANPDFFTKPKGPIGNIILTPQFDDSQYKRLNSKYLDEFKNADYEGNSCSEAVIAEVLKTYTYFKTGDVPDVTIADIINYLMDINYQGYRLIHPNDTSMEDDPFKWGLGAMEHFGKETNLYTVTQLTPDWGLDKTQIIPTNEWAGLFRMAREKILDKSGILVARVLKYGRPPGTEGHFIMMSSLNAGSEPLIVDSIGPYKNHQRQGDARTIALRSYVEDALGGGHGFIWMAGVVPTF
jgi:hypothetical protein